MATVGAEAAMAGAVVVSTGEAFAVALSTPVPVSVEGVSPLAVFMAVAFVVAVLIGTITDSPMMSLSAATVIQAGGTGGIRTDITVTTITRTIIMDTADTHTAMDTAGTVTTVPPVMDMEAEQVMDMAMAADHGIPGVRGVGDSTAKAL